MAYLTDIFDSSSAFSFVLFKLDQPAWGFRSALAKYYELFPNAYGPAMTVTEQGNW